MTEHAANWPTQIVSPMEVGFRPDRMDVLTETMQRWVDDGSVAGMITLMARGDRIGHLHLYGQMDITRELPMREDTIFRIYSMSKIITTVAMLMLYEEGHFLLDQPVSKFIPAFADLKVKIEDPDGDDELVAPKREVTFHDLLTHTGGLSYNVYPEAAAGGWTLKQFMDKFVKQPLISQPGERWNYSASNDVQGYLIELISGVPFEQFLQERLFQPLGMTDTGFALPPEKIDRLMVQYTRDKFGKLIDNDPHDKSRWINGPMFPSGGGGMLSTTSDYLRFAQMLLGEGELNTIRVLSRKTVELMTCDHLPHGHGAIEPFKFRYGLGVSVLADLGETQCLGSPGEYGWGGAACTQCWIDPYEDLITIIMTQYRPTEERFALMNTFKTLAYQALA